MNVMQQTRYLASSFLLHSFVLIFSVYCWQAKPIALPAANGNDFSGAYQVKLYKDSSAEMSKTSQENVKQTLLIKQTIQKKSIVIPVATKSTQAKQKQGTKKAEKISQTKKALSGSAVVSEFFGRLHDHIDRFKHYPQSALLMEREGKVQFEFILHQDGSVHELKVAQSSGTQSLDEAAKQAILKAAPIPFANQYVHEPTPCIVNLVFTLT